MDADVTAPMRGVWTESTNKSIFKITQHLPNRIELGRKKNMKKKNGRK